MASSTLVVCSHSNVKAYSRLWQSKLTEITLCSHKDYHNGICVGYIPAKRDIRHVISSGEGQCLSEAEEGPRAFLGFTKVLPFPEGYNGSYLHLAGIYLTCTKLRLF